MPEIVANGKTPQTRVVCSRKQLSLMTDRSFDESRLARAAGVYEQTISNSLNSSRQKPWHADKRSLTKVCAALETEYADFQMDVEMLESIDSSAMLVADKQSPGDTATVRSVAGKWFAMSEDREVPGDLTYRQPIPWHGTITIEQQGNQFEAYGEDNDGDGVFATGVLLECGNFLRFNY